MSDTNELFRPIAEKWGFGMAPPKADTQEHRVWACGRVLDALQLETPPAVSPLTLEALSTVKGLFGRVTKEDQWDWFTVAGQLGYPSRAIANRISRGVTELRTAMFHEDVDAFRNARHVLLQLPLRQCLTLFLGEAALPDIPGSGWVYILSSREFSELLKVGMTSRSVERRAQEINSATGVAVPFGVRRCWRVRDPREAEKCVHEVLHQHRLRGDREFFKVPFPEAAKLVDEALSEHDLIVQTLAYVA